MSTMTYGQAIREAMSIRMREDPGVILFGEDVGAFGGCFGVSAGMHPYSRSRKPSGSDDAPIQIGSALRHRRKARISAVFSRDRQSAPITHNRIGGMIIEALLCKTVPSRNAGGSKQDGRIQFLSRSIIRHSVRTDRKSILVCLSRNKDWLCRSVSAKSCCSSARRCSSFCSSLCSSFRRAACGRA